MSLASAVIGASDVLGGASPYTVVATGGFQKTSANSGTLTLSALPAVGDVIVALFLNNPDGGSNTISGQGATWSQIGTRTIGCEARFYTCTVVTPSTSIAWGLNGSGHGCGVAVVLRGPTSSTPSQHSEVTTGTSIQLAGTATAAAAGLAVVGGCGDNRSTQTYTSTYDNLTTTGTSSVSTTAAIAMKVVANGDTIPTSALQFTNTASGDIFEEILILPMP